MEREKINLEVKISKILCKDCQIMNLKDVDQKQLVFIILLSLLFVRSHDFL